MIGTNPPGPVPYLKDKFFAELSQLADIEHLSSQTFEELETDFKTKYDRVKVIYHLRDPGSPFGHVTDHFLKLVPESCAAMCHRESLRAAERLLNSKWVLVTMTLTLRPRKGSAFM